MDAYELATKPGGRQVPMADFINHVKLIADPDVRNLVKVMQKRLPKHQLYSRIYGDRMPEDHVGDCESLVARLLRDRSSHNSPSTMYLNRQLQNLAWDKGRHLNVMDDWNLAQKKYVNRGLDYLESLLKQ
jgi:hypothetical protein